jgi:hypothetical protein
MSPRCSVPEIRRGGAGGYMATRVEDDTEIGGTGSSGERAFGLVPQRRRFARPSPPLLISVSLSLSLSLSLARSRSLYSGTGLPWQTTDRTMKSHVLNGTDV